MAEDDEVPETITSPEELKRALEAKFVSGTDEERQEIVDALSNLKRKQQGKPPLR